MWVSGSLKRSVLLDECAARSILKRWMFVPRTRKMEVALLEIQERYLCVCPLFGKELDEYECGDTCLVVEGVSPDSEIPLGLTLEGKNLPICLECKDHLPK